MPRTITALPWSPNLLPESGIPNITPGLGGPPRPAWLPPLLRVAPDERPWLAGPQGQVVRGGKEWERIELPGSPVQGLAPQAGGGAVLLVGPVQGPWSLLAVDAGAQARWRVEVPEPAGPGGPPMLLQDEQGRPYLFRADRGGAVRQVDVATGGLTTVADLPGYNAPVLVWEGAVWRMQYQGGQRRWIRRPFGGTDQEVSAAEPLQDTMLTAIGVRPDGGPLLTDGGRLLSVTPAGAVTEIPLPPAAGPRVLDLLRASPRPGGGVWVVAADAQGATIYALDAAK